MSMEDFICEVEKKLTDACTVNDLVKAKIFTSATEAMLRRKRGEPPEYIRLGRKRIIYPKTCVLQWLRDNVNKGSKK